MTKDIHSIIQSINDYCKSLVDLSSDELRDKFEILKSKASSKADSLEDIIVEVFAMVKETMRRFATDGKIVVKATEHDKYLASKYDYINIYGDRAVFNNCWSVVGEKMTWNMIPYDEQLYGGVEIHRGRILQMATGEGKTLVVVAPAILNAIGGSSVHVMTVNEYLSIRDFELTHPIYSFFGISTGCIEGKAHGNHCRKEAYSCDITYGTTSGFVFDYLYDHIATDKSNCVQDRFDFIIIDEADSVLLDEALNPHLISQDCSETEKTFSEYLTFVKQLTETNSADLFILDKLRKKVELTEKGKQMLAKICRDPILFDDNYYGNKISNIQEDEYLTNEQKKGLIFAEQNKRLTQLHIQNVINKLLKALTVYEKDVHYVVKKGIIIIDQNTGRLRPTCRWEYGLHEAIEAKEEVKPNININSIAATINIKNYVSLYTKIAGMTGTAIAAKDEFCDVYKLKVTEIPTHKPIIREDFPLRVFTTKNKAYEALANEVKRLHDIQRPVLIGVNSIIQSERIENILVEKGIKPCTLNALTSLNEEASVIASAGEISRITLATNIAGRGTDIKPSQDALKIGGLAVLGCGIAHSKRIDEQLIGRSGRQGNPGSSLFFASIEDDIVGYLSKEDKDYLHKIAKETTSNNGEIIDMRATEMIVRAQRINEREDMLTRSLLAKRDDIIQPFRKNLYDVRMKLLQGDLNGCIEGRDLFSFFKDSVFVAQYNNHNTNLKPQILEIAKRALPNLWHVKTTIPIPLLAEGQLFAIDCDFRDAIRSNGNSVIKEIEQQLMIYTIDKLWISFINEINNELIPETEYESIYNNHFDSSKDKLSHILLTSTVPIDNAGDNISEDINGLNSRLSFAKKEDLLDFTEQCPCGSGKQYWQCHGLFKMGVG